MIRSPAQLALTLAAAFAGAALALRTASQPHAPELALHRETIASHTSPTLSPHRTNEFLSALRAKLAQSRAIATGDAQAQTKANRELLALLTPENAADIARLLSPEELGTPFGLAALERWLARDASTAACWLAAQSSITDSQAILVAHALLRDPAQLNSLCDELAATPAKQTLLATLAREAADTAPAIALAVAQRLDAGPVQTDALETIAYAWMASDPRAAAEWILHLDDPAQRASLLPLAAKSIAATDPELAASWLADTTGTDDAVTIADAWAASAPEKAATWAAKFPASPSREAALEAIARQWQRTDRTRALSWIASLPEHDHLLATLAPDAPSSADPE